MKRKVALVTGANSGIGAGITYALANSGWSVFGAYYSHKERADNIILQLTDKDAQVCMVKADFADPCFSIESLVNLVISEFGDLNVLINCAAEVSSKPFQEVSDEYYNRIMRINLQVPFFLCQAVYREFIKGNCNFSSVVNISSVSERFAWQGLSVYEISKAGLSMLTRTLGYNFASDGIRVNAVAPGSIEVERCSEDKEWKREVLCNVIPMGRPGTPCDVTSTVLYLISDASKYVTGQVVYVDGGLSLRL